MSVTGVINFPTGYNLPTGETKRKLAHRGKPPGGTCPGADQAERAVRGRKVFGVGLWHI